MMFMKSLVLRMLGSLVSSALVDRLLNLIIMKLKEVASRTDTTLDDELLDALLLAARRDGLVEGLKAWLNNALKAKEVVHIEGKILYPDLKDM